MPFPFLAAGALIVAGGAASAMGGTKSNTQTIVNDITSKVVNESITEVTDELISKNKINVNTQAIVDFTNKGIMSCSGNLNISASAKTKTQQIASAFKNSENEFVNNLTTAINKEISNLAKQENKSDWSDVFKKNQENIINVMNKQNLITEQLVQNSITDNLKIDTEQNSKTVSKVTFINEGVMTVVGDCNFTADSVVELISESLAEKISNTLIENDLDQELSISIKTDADQINTAASLWPIIIGAIIILMIFGGVGFFMLGDDEEGEEFSGGLSKIFKGGLQMQQGFRSARRRGKSALFNIALVIFMICFTISFIVYIVKLWNSIGFCDDDTEIPYGVVPGGNTPEQIDKCWDGLTADPPKMEKYKDTGGLCDYDQQSFNDYMNEKTKQSGNNWNLDDFKPPWQNCDDKEHYCGFCRNEKPLSKSVGLVFKRTWKWGSAITMYIFIGLMILTLMVKGVMK